MRILILGGYGIFGGRLAEILLRYPQITLIIAGRSQSKAQEFCERLRSERAMPMVISRNDEIGTLLVAEQVQLLVDASGPFQAYGNDPYRLARQCIEAGVNYLDFADGAEFAQGISVLDEQARAAQVWALSGASSFPVLTAAVMRRIVKQEGLEPTAVHAGIAPSPYAGFGLNVIKAIAGYAGRKIPIVKDGKVQSAYALTTTMSYTVSVPGQLPLDHRLFALVEVPDLLVLKTAYPTLQKVWVGAAPVPKLLLRSLIWMAFGVRWRLLPNLSFAAPLFHAMVNLLRWGEHRGGMFVKVRGQHASGQMLTCSWHMLAEGDDGPYIPCMAIEAIVRRDLAGLSVAVGARPATHDVELEEYETLFAERRITTAVRVHKPGLGLYEQILGPAWKQLPLQIQQVHSTQARQVLEGQAEVRGGSNGFARFIARVLGFPTDTRAVALKVIIERNGQLERWTRDFGGQSFTSELSAGQNAQAYLLTEKIAGLSFDIALLIRDQGVNWQLRGWRWGRLRLPLALAPRCYAREAEQEGAYAFDVSLSLAICGQLVAYRGILRSVQEQQTA